jgi:hypothetical protein
MIAVAVPAIDGACPKGVIDQLDGLYRWQVKRMNGNDDPAKALSSQNQRFTPSLFKLLIEARQLTPTRDGRFLDFDVFSNTQVSTFGAKVTGCSAKQANSIQAEVSVDVGLRGRSSGTPRRLLYAMNNSKGGWLINNITYLDGKVFQLKPFLQKLLKPTP